MMLYFENYIKKIVPHGQANSLNWKRGRIASRSEFVSTPYPTDICFGDS